MRRAKHRGAKQRRRKRRWRIGNMAIQLTRKEQREWDLCGLGRIARPPKRRGMNEPQIAFDQRLQALRITMARPRFETFSIRAF